MTRTLAVCLGSSVWLAAALGACQRSEGPTLETPPRVFTTERFRFEERRGDKVLWRGHASRSEGSLDDAVLDDVTLQRVPQKASETPLEVTAPRAQLDFEAGRAVFFEAVVHDDQEGEIVAGTARYDEATQTLVAEGPLTLRRGALRAQGSRAVVRVDTQVVDVVGPVTGTFDPQGQETSKRDAP